MNANQATSIESGDGREKILDAAESLFASHGFEGASMQQIARAAGISKATIFHHFASKQDLYCAVIRRACEGTSALLDEFAAQPGSEPLAQLAEYRRRDLKEALAHGQVFRLIMRELTLGEEGQAKALVDQVFGEHYLLLRRVVERAQQAGSLRDDADAGVQAVAVVGLNAILMLIWPVLKHLPDSPFTDIEATAETVYDMLLNGMKKQGEPS